MAKKVIKVLSAYRFGLEVYGVKVGIETDRRWFFDKIKNELPILLPLKLDLLNYEDASRFFGIETFKKNFYRVEIDGEPSYETSDRITALHYFLRHLRIKIAECAESRVFLHAGVVGIDGKALIMPAKSFQGKSRLVAALIESGADYYSDEYAVLDEAGFVHPFPKMISLREEKDRYVQKDVPLEKFACRIGKVALPVGLILFTEYMKKSVWQPKKLSVSEAMLEILPHTIPIRYKPEFCLEVLNKVLSRAIILKSKRDEALGMFEILRKYLSGNKNF